MNNSKSSGHILLHDAIHFTSFTLRFMMKIIELGEKFRLCVLHKACYCLTHICTQNRSNKLNREEVENEKLDIKHLPCLGLCHLLSRLDESMMPPTALLGHQ